MAQYSMEFDLSQIKELQDAINKFGAANKDVLPATSAAFHSSAEYVQNLWSNYVYGGGKLDGLEPLEKPLSPKNVKFHIEDKGDFSSSVVSSSRQLETVQNGENPVDYDMKKTHPYGRKSRVSKKGIPYLIIPFRWGTPNGKGSTRRWNNVIPQKEYETIIKGFESSKTTGLTHAEMNYKGQAIDRAEYIWKTRLKEVDAWDDRSIGMIRMKDVRGSTYFTFRIVSAKSPSGSWMYHKDGKSAIDMLSALDRTARTGVEKIIESGIQKDLELFQ